MTDTSFSHSQGPPPSPHPRSASPTANPTVRGSSARLGARWRWVAIIQTTHSTRRTTTTIQGARATSYEAPPAAGDRAVTPQAHHYCLLPRPPRKLQRLKAALLLLRSLRITPTPRLLTLLDHYQNSSTHPPAPHHRTSRPQPHSPVRPANPEPRSRYYIRLHLSSASHVQDQHRYGPIPRRRKQRVLPGVIPLELTGVSLTRTPSPTKSEP